MVADRDIYAHLDESGATRNRFFEHIMAQGCRTYGNNAVGRRQFENDWHDPRQRRRVNGLIGLYGQPFAQAERLDQPYQAGGGNRPNRQPTSLDNLVVRAAGVGAIALGAAAFVNCGGGLDYTSQHPAVYLTKWAVIVGGAVAGLTFIRNKIHGR